MFNELINDDKGSIYIDGYKYFFKRNDAYVEILVEKIMDLFYLNHVHYIPIRVNDKDYYISKDLNSDGTFITAEDMGLISSNLDDIRDFIRNRFPNNYEYLFNDILKMYYMDLMILNIDRSNSNWGFFINDKDVNIYLLDNDLSFIDYKSYFTSLDNNTYKDSKLEIYNIFNSFSDKDIELFYDMYSLLDYDMLVKLIRETEIDINKELLYKDNYLERFNTMRWFIENNMKKRIVKKKILS